MTLASLVLFAVLIIVLGVFLVSSVVGLGLTLHLGARLNRGLYPWVFPAISMVMVSGPIFSGRNLSGLGVLFDATPENFIQSRWISRLLTMAVLALSMERILRTISRRESLLPYGWPLVAAFLLFVITNEVLNGIFGTRPGLDHSALYSLVVIPAALFAANTDRERSLIFARNAIFGMLVASIAVLLIRPEVVLEKNYGGLFGPRFWGLATHANTLSPLLVMFLALLWQQPFQRRSLNTVGWALGLTALFASQSKTSLIALPLVMAILGYYRMRNWIKREPDREKVKSACLLLVVAGIVVGVAVLITHWVLDLGYVYYRFSHSPNARSLLSLTNRDQIWSFALREWSLNPFFGYGPYLFDVNYRQLIGIPVAFHAHNQWLQTLGGSGLVGLFGLGLYLVLLCIYALRASAESHGLSLALLALVIVRSITEVPLRTDGIMNSEFFGHAMLLIVCIGYGASSRGKNSVLLILKGVGRHQP